MGEDPGRVPGEEDDDGVWATQRQLEAEISGSSGTVQIDENGSGVV
jgi:hypothetical protein